MNRKISFVLSVVLVLAAACRAKEPAASTEAAPGASAETPAAAAPAETPPPASAPTGTPAGVPASAPAAVLASQETNWQGIAADVTEFRRKGNTLTAKVVIRNHGSGEAQPDINYKEVYLMDLAAGKKYEVLKDEKGAYIAALRSNWNDRWYETLKPGESYTLWMKFPAPPADVKAVTLQIPGAPPFEDLAIQDV
ncbi:MAG TPA: hypothetical protein VGX68_10715 [Thermoanaerobaculia bacterium]|jgi:hypothetical protein|nr:hypothetical protein [Thermoanaerobaculia bacterium]